MTATAAAPPETERGPVTGWAARFVQLAWVTRFEWWLLGAIAAVGAIARSGGFSSGTLFRDDAWVALTTRVPLGTAARMVVTTPGFVLAERAWIGWFPHTVVDQLPTFVASVAGIVAVGRLARWWGLSAPASLFAAAVVATSYSDIQYATRIKPYAFDLLGSCLVLYLAERCRRDGSRSAPWLAAATVAVCAFSLTPVPLVVGVWLALGADAAVRRAVTTRLVASGAAAAGALVALWLAVRPGISPRLRDSWAGYYVVVTSAHGFAHSVRTIVDGLVRGIGATTPVIGVHGLGTLDRVALLVLGVAGLAAWRRQLLSLAAVAAAVVLTVPTLVPLGTGRTDAYLYPALAMVLAEGATVLWHLARRTGPTVATVVLCAALALGGLVAADRVRNRPGYPGGDLARVAAVVDRGLARGDRVLIGGTVRWPWSYYDVHHVRISFSRLYNNGYTTRSDDLRVIMMPGTPIEGGYLDAVRNAAARLAATCGTVFYVESNDWPSMPMTLLHALVSPGGFTVVKGPVVVGGYRYWQLTNVGTCTT